MKFTVYHTRYGYYGIEDEMPVYKDNDLSEAALFSNESAKELLVDIYDPQIIVTPMTDKQIAKLPFELFDTDLMIQNKYQIEEQQTQESQEMTANTFHHVGNIIENLNIIDEKELILELDDLEIPITLHT